MTDQENMPEGLAGLVQLWIVQLRRITEGLAGMAGLGESALSRTVPALRGLALPGALSAAQLDSIARRVAAQRSSIAAMQAQLAAFDEQLAVLEGILGPLTEWGKTWARFERLVLPARGDPAAEG